MKWQDRISMSPNVCHGKPCIRGTRVLVSVVLADVAMGEPFEAIMSGYHIGREDIQAALYFAVDLAQDRYMPLPETILSGCSWTVDDVGMRIRPGGQP